MPTEANIADDFFMHNNCSTVQWTIHSIVKVGVGPVGISNIGLVNGAMPTEPPVELIMHCPEWV